MAFLSYLFCDVDRVQQELNSSCLEPISPKTEHTGKTDESHTIVYLVNCLFFVIKKCPIDLDFAFDHGSFEPKRLLSIFPQLTKSILVLWKIRQNNILIFNCKHNLFYKL